MNLTKKKINKVQRSCQQFQNLFTGRDRLDMVVELKVQYCRGKLQDSFNTNETFLRCTIFKLERKVVCHISPVVSVSRGMLFFYNSKIPRTKQSFSPQYCTFRSTTMSGQSLPLNHLPFPFPPPLLPSSPVPVVFSYPCPLHKWSTINFILKGTEQQFLKGL